jgi:hypothetical protein
MHGRGKKIGLGQLSDIRVALGNLCCLLRLLSAQPTHVCELVIDMPCYVGYHDAAAEGACGVWFSLIHGMPPLVWQIPFPPDIATEIVSPQHLHGWITNPNLEFATEVLAIGVLLAKAPIVKHEPIGTLCNNTPTVSWIAKMASKSASPITGCLLRGLAYMLYCYQARWLTTVNVYGPDNIMADIASCPSKVRALF